MPVRSFLPSNLLRLSSVGAHTRTHMAPSCASHVTRAVVREVVDRDGEDRSYPAWQPALYKLPPFFTDVSIVPEEEEVLAQKVHRDLLASQAQARYEAWLEENPPSKPDIRPQTSTHPNSHRFRDRDREKELAPKHWQNPNRVMHERERIEAVLNSSLYTLHPPYPKQGGGIKNLEFSFMKASYDYRQRLPSNHKGILPDRQRDVIHTAGKPGETLHS